MFALQLFCTTIIPDCFYIANKDVCTMINLVSSGGWLGVLSVTKTAMETLSTTSDTPSGNSE